MREEDNEHKYFVPHVEDLHIGYESEIHRHYLGGNPYWEPIVFKVEEIETNRGSYDFLDMGGGYRTKYLDKEAIEAEGWVYGGTYAEIQTYKIGDIWQDDGKSGFLNYDPINHILKITTTDKGFNQEGPNNSIKFHGECKSINEFRKIMQWIKK